MDLHSGLQDEGSKNKGDGYICVVLDRGYTTMEEESYLFWGEDTHSASIFSQGHTHFSQQGFSEETGTYSWH